MMLAFDPKTSLMVRPNPGAVGIVCPYCTGPMVAKCGAIIEDHWAHKGETCQEWTVTAESDKRGEATPGRSHAKGTCVSCRHWFEGYCRHYAAETRRWTAEYLVGTDGHAPVIADGAPQCPWALDVFPAEWKARNPVLPGGWRSGRLTT